MGKLFILLFITVSWFLGDEVEAEWKPPGSIFNGDSAASMMDGLVAFAANYGNAAADYMASDSDAGATGSIENIGRFNLRLIRCTSVQGGMTRYFPANVSPNTTHNTISGYAKIKRHSIAITRGVAKLEQSCVYAVYDVIEKENGKWEDKERAVKKVTKWLKLGFNVLKNVLHANQISVDFAEHQDTAWKTNPFENVNREDKIKDDKNKEQRVFRRTSVPHRVCHVDGDMCVEAIIGTGPNPRFRFKILPKKLKDLARKACVDTYSGVLNWDKDAKYTEEDAKSKWKETKGAAIPVGVCLRSTFCKYMANYYDVLETVCNAAV